MSDATTPDGRLWITVLDQGGAGTRQVEIHPSPSDGTYRLTLRCLPGADAVHIPIGDARGLRFRCEIPAAPETLVDLALIPDADGGLIVESTLPGLRVLPPDPAGEPLAPLPGAAAQRPAPRPPGPRGSPDAADPWEVVLVIDGTARWFQPDAKEVAERTGLLLADPNRWGAVRTKLIELLQELRTASGNAGLAFSVLAFGDHAIPGVHAEQLRPKYDLWVPAPRGELRLWPFVSKDAAAMLAGLRATPGGDFVDALADALSACVALPWTPGARKLLVLFGDSPGHSLAHPVSGLGNAQVRHQDVDLAAAALHRKGVEILTLYNRPPAGLDLRKADKAQVLLQDAAEQYRRLASVSGYALDSADLDPAAVARQLRERDFPIGRGPSYGLMV